MRCALCGGEIDSRTKQCTKCGECWGGGNRGIAREVSRETSAYPSTITPSRRFQCSDNIQKAVSAVDRAFVRSVGKIASSLKIKTSVQQNRAIAYGVLFFIISVILIVSVVSCTACRKHEICGTWIPEDSEGSVAIELSADGEAKLLIISDGTERVYRKGLYSVSGDLLELCYDDGERITLTFTIDGDNAVFTLLSTGESQTYKRK